MTLAEYLRVVRAQWLLIAVVTALGGLGATTWSWLQTPIYSATATLFVGTQGGNDIADLSTGSSFTQQRVKSYADIITAPAVLEPVIEDLSLRGVTPRELAERVSASSPLDTVLLEVTVTDTNPERARDLANGIAGQFTAYVAELELPSGSGRSPVKVTVPRPATTPGVPDSPRTTLNLALGVLVGLGLGLGAAVLRDTLDRTIGPRHDAGALVGAPVLSSINDDPEVKTAPLIVHHAFSPRAEAFRQLRTNIRFLGVDTEVRSLVVTSSVAAEGKSTTAANLAIALAQGGDKVVLIDADLRRPTVADTFGLPGGVGLTSVLLGDVPLVDAVQPWRDDLALWVLASGPVPPNPSELIGSHRMVAVVEQLVTEGYVVVVDSPPLLPVTDATILARITTGALLVVRARSTRIEQLTAATEALRTAAATVHGVVVNAVPRTGTGYAYSVGGYGYGPRTGAITLPPVPPSSPDVGIALPDTLAAGAAPVVVPPPPPAAAPVLPRPGRTPRGRRVAAPDHRSDRQPF